MRRYALPLLTRAHKDYSAVRRLIVCLLFLAIVSTPQLKAQDAAETGAIDGYWELTAEFLDYDLNTTVRFKTAADAQTVEGIVLGPTSGRDSSFIGKISNNHLLLKVPGPIGEMQIDLTVAGGNLSGTWTAAESKGNVKGARVALRKPEPDYYAKYLKAVIQLIKENFYDPQLNGVDTEKLRAKYTAQLTDVKDDADFVKLIRCMLDEFKTSHLDFYLAPTNLPIKEKTPLVTWRKLSPQTHYLKIRHFDPLTPDDQQSYYQLLEKAVKEVGNSPALIIDLRGNRGGNIAVMFQALGYFLQPGQDVSYAFVQAGASKASAFSNEAKSGAIKLPVVKTTSPSLIGDIARQGAVVIKHDAEQKKRYRGKIVLLVDELCYSSCELFSAILQEKGKATVIGKRTGGEVLGSFTDSLVKNMIVMKKDTGWRLEIPIMDFRTTGGKRIEGNGVKPDIEITRHGEPDAVLAEALKYLEQALATQKQ